MKCRVCPKVYKSKTACVYHMRNKHQVDYDTSFLIILWKRIFK